MNVGEVGMEMYWILEGECEVFSKTGTFLANLQKGQPFGEMALLSHKTNVRQTSIIAKSDGSLPVLDRNDFRFVLENYQDFRERVNQ